MRRIPNGRGGQYAAARTRDQLGLRLTALGEALKYRGERSKDWDVPDGASFGLFGDQATRTGKCLPAGGSVWQLTAEYETIAVEAQQQRWISLLETGGLASEQIDELVAADSFGVLAAELRRMEADGHNNDELLPRVIWAGNLTDVDDLGSLLRYRMQRLTALFAPTASRKRRPLMVGLIPAAAGPMSQNKREALEQRECLIQDWVTALAQAALAQRLP